MNFVGFVEALWAQGLETERYSRYDTLCTLGHGALLTWLWAAQELEECKVGAADGEKGAASGSNILSPCRSLRHK